MTQDRKPSITDWERVDEELLKARRLYDEGFTTFQQFKMDYILRSLAERVRPHHAIKWHLAKRPRCR